MKINNFKDLLGCLLQDIKFIHKQSLEIYPKFKDKAQSKELKKVLENHIKELQQELPRVEKFIISLAVKVDEESSAKSVFALAEKLLHENTPSPLLDAAMMATIQKIEYLEASSYSSLEAFAETLNFDELISFLEISLREIHKMENLLENLEEHKIFSPMKVP